MVVQKSVLLACAGAVVVAAVEPTRLIIVAMPAILPEALTPPASGVGLQAKFLARMTPDAVSRRLERAASREVDTVRPNAVQAAIEDVRENPFDLSSIRELRDIEMQRGQDTMVAYLETRIRGLERGGEVKR